jgi:sporulation protein YlmC with PRC-barrel domain
MDGVSPDHAIGREGGYRLYRRGCNHRSAPAFFLSKAETSKERLKMTPSTTTTSDVISSERVEGTAVYNDAGEKLGSIDDLMIDKRSGQVRYAVLEFGGFLGMGTDRYPLPWNMLNYDIDKEGYVVPLNKEKLAGAPRYGDADVPDYTPEYSRKVDIYYDHP